MYSTETLSVIPSPKTCLKKSGNSLILILSPGLLSSIFFSLLHWLITFVNCCLSVITVLPFKSELKGDAFLSSLTGIPFLSTVTLALGICKNEYPNALNWSKGTFFIVFSEVPSKVFVEVGILIDSVGSFPFTSPSPSPPVSPLRCSATILPDLHL